MVSVQYYTRHLGWTTVNCHLGGSTGWLVSNQSSTIGHWNGMPRVLTVVNEGHRQYRQETLHPMDNRSRGKHPRNSKLLRTGVRRRRVNRWTVIVEMLIEFAKRPLKREPCRWNGTSKEFLQQVWRNLSLPLQKELKYSGCRLRIYIIHKLFTNHFLGWGSYLVYFNSYMLRKRLSVFTVNVYQVKYILCY